MNATDSTTRAIVQTVYDKLIERGRSRGHAVGLAEGKAVGLAEGKVDLLLQMLEARFGSLPPGVVRRVRRAKVAQIDQWARRLLTAPSLDELLGG